MPYGRKDTHCLFSIWKMKNHGVAVMRFTGTSYSRLWNKRGEDANNRGVGKKLKIN